MLTRKGLQIDSTGEYEPGKVVINKKIEELLSQKLQLKTQIIKIDNEYSLTLAKIEDVVNRLDTYSDFLDGSMRKMCMPLILKVTGEINQILDEDSEGLQII